MRENIRTHTPTVYTQTNKNAHIYTHKGDDGVHFCAIMDAL